MASATKTTRARGGGGPALLKGSDIPKSAQRVTVFVNQVREAPEQWGSPLVADIDEVHGAKAIALNKTNVKHLVRLIGDDYDDWAGFEVTFEKVRVNNPTTGEMTTGLEVAGVKKSKRKPKPPSDDEVPF